VEGGGGGGEVGCNGVEEVVAVMYSGYLEGSEWSLYYLSAFNESDGSE